ncbi:MAG: TonB-dependent siderophore receptor [Ponticaulis sp.]|nr:TonB-dependent siderophore receptor [Ponticaulis sp.]
MRASLLTLSLALGLAANAQAQTSDEADDESRQDTIIVTGQVGAFGATKSDTPITETARSVSVEPAELFIEKGAVNLSQTVSYLSGVTAETYGFSTRGDWVSARGLQVPRYRDSIQELFGSYNTTRVEPWTIEQVEVLKGPSSVLFGQGSPGGLLNVVSKTPQDTFSGEIVGEVGNYDRYQIAGDVTGPVAGTNDQLLFRAVGLYRDTGSQVDNVDETSTVLMPSLSWAPTSDTRLTLIGMYQDNENDVAAQFIPVQGTLFPHQDTGDYIDQDVYAGDPDFNFFDTSSTQVTLLGEHRVNDAIQLEATALWRSGEADYQQAWPVFYGARYANQIPELVALMAAYGVSVTDTTVPRTFYRADNTFDQAAIDVRARMDFDTGPLQHEVLAGIQYQDIETDSNTAYCFGGGVLPGYCGSLAYELGGFIDLANPDYSNAPLDQINAALDEIYVDAPVQTVTDLGLYLSDQIALGNWRFTLGLRADQVENDDGTTQQDDDAISTSVGVLYRFNNGIAPYASYSESFEPVIGTDQITGEQLKPQEARQYEVGLKYEPTNFPGLVTLAYYDIEISNLGNPNALPNAGSQQEGISELKGFELEAHLRFDDWYIQGAASTIDAKDPNGFELSGQPDSNASVWLGWTPQGPLEGFKAGAGVRYVGESVSENANIRYESPDYTLGDLMIGYEWDRWDFQINARNITDETYLTSCLTRGDCFPGLRRTVVGRLGYKF